MPSADRVPVKSPHSVGVPEGSLKRLGVDIIAGITGSERFACPARRKLPGKPPARKRARLPDPQRILYEQSSRCHEYDNTKSPLRARRGTCRSVISTSASATMSRHRPRTSSGPSRANGRHVQCGGHWEGRAGAFGACRHTSFVTDVSAFLSNRAFHQQHHGYQHQRHRGQHQKDIEISECRCLLLAQILECLQG